ncbi:MAG: hypothetical protein HQL28_04795 [Candidatus Omnitrophica bacterium]|nr:hypothetical protein [Candidatus Omnitrophota bacterium]
MKKCILVLLVLVLASGVCAFAQMAPNWYTDGRLNGHFVLEASDADKINYYIQGVLDTLSVTNKGIIDKYYKDQELGNIYDMVTEYYTKNSDKADRSVINLLVSGCK